jgi:hypothetical protein
MISQAIASISLAEMIAGLQRKHGFSSEAAFILHAS